LIEVGAFTRDQSLGYLAARTGLASDADAGLVADALGDLPLGLAQAAATISGQRLSYGRYLGRLAAVPVAGLLGRVPGGDYPHGTAAALLLNAETAEAGDPSGLTATMLRVIAVLSPDGVRRNLLDGLAGGGDTARVDEAAGQCVTWSLLSWSVTGEELTMHRLTGRVLRERDHAGGRLGEAAGMALDLLEPAMFSPDQAWRRREDGAHLVGQAEAVWDAAAGSDDVGLAARALNALGWAVLFLTAA
jgi:hypothetical protein